MAIKNWTVKTKQIKKKSDGLIKHFNYLNDKKRASHFYSDIVDLNNSPEKIQNILDEVENRQEYRRENGLRGGGVSNLATSFVVSIPRDIQQPTTKKEWQKIASLTLKELADDLDLPFEKIRDRSVAILHDESNSPDKSSHIHILVSNIIDGQVVKPISQYKGTYAMKKGINKAVKNVLGEDNKLYVPKNSNIEDKPLYVAREEKLLDQELKIDEKQNKLNEDFKEKKEDLKNERIEFKNEKNRFYKAVKFAKQTLSKWIKAVRNNQTDELEKRAKQSAKVIVDMEDHLPEVAKELTNVARFEEEQAELLDELREEMKVTHQVELAQEKKEKKKRKKRTRTRTN